MVGLMSLAVAVSCSSASNGQPRTGKGSRSIGSQNSGISPVYKHRIARVPPTLDTALCAMRSHSSRGHVTESDASLISFPCTPAGAGRRHDPFCRSHWLDGANRRRDWRTKYSIAGGRPSSRSCSYSSSTGHGGRSNCSKRSHSPISAGIGTAFSATRPTMERTVRDLRDSVIRHDFFGLHMRLLTEESASRTLAVATTRDPHLRRLPPLLCVRGDSHLRCRRRQGLSRHGRGTSRP
jgi:hypothetical protein